jgi:hypothetical protein
MDNLDFAPSPAPLPAVTPRKGGFRRALLLTGSAFVIGLAVMGWAVSRWEPARRLLVDSRPIDSGAVLDGASGLDKVSGVDAVSGIDVAPGLATTPAPRLPAPPSDRLAELEQKLDEIDQTADAASGNAGRAEGLLVAFAARRAVDRGLALGYLEASLQSRFGKAQPRAVAMIINASRQPVTIEDLRTGLDAIGSSLVGGGPDESWWNSFRRSMSSLIIVRKAATPSPAPIERLGRVERLVDAGRVDAALAEVARMPGAGGAMKWMDQARRYVEAHRALDVLEAASIMPATRVAAPPAVAPTDEVPTAKAEAGDAI